MSAPAPPYSTRERDPHQPELAELAHDLVRERLRGVELAGDGRDALARELAHRALDQRVIVGEVEVHDAATIQSKRSENQMPAAPHPPRAPRPLRPPPPRRRRRRGARLRRARLPRDDDRRAARRDRALERAPSTTTSTTRDELLILICDELMDPLLERAHAILADDAPPERAAARAGARLARAHRAPPRPHARLPAGAPRDRARAALARDPRQAPGVRATCSTPCSRAPSESGAITIPDRRLALLALLGMVNYTPTWFRPGGRLRARQIADGYTDLLLDAYQAQPPESAP